MSITERSRKLRALVRLLTDASEVVIKKWEAESAQVSKNDSSPPGPSFELFEARRAIVGACGMCIDLVQDPLVRLSEVSISFYAAKALHIAAKVRIADRLAIADSGEGVSIESLSKQIGMHDKKLSQILRCLCSLHIFTEVKNNYFANTPTSQFMVNNEGFRAWLLMGDYGTPAAQKLPTVLLDPIKTRSSSPREAAFQEAYGTTLTMWEYIEQEVKQPDGTMGARPELDMWVSGMVVGSQVEATGTDTDYPWQALGSSTVVDVGGGIGGLSLVLAKKFPDLKFIIQDREAVAGKAEAVWLKELPTALQTGRVSFQAHDFFHEQPFKGADVYCMKHILHNWPDDECVTILKHLCQAMRPDSRLLIVDKVVNTTAGSPLLKKAPSPLSPNYGHAQYFSGLMSLLMLTLFNGMERTAEELSVLAVRAGLKVEKIWECRGLIYVTELRKDDYNA